MKILAVSGGVDSVAMLDLLVSEKIDDLVVAHFDHGIRELSNKDCEFVEKLAKKYNLQFYSRRAELGAEASEETARKARYAFLFDLAKKLHGEVYTAHHVDDLAESVAINLLRGTGWRGLAALNQSGIKRPFLEKGWRKTDILKYAAEHNLSFCQDPTNNSDAYLRNRVRKELYHQTNIDFQQILELWRKQVELSTKIDALMAEIAPRPGESWQRDWFKKLPAPVAQELLRQGLLQAGISVTRPQLEDFRQAILNYGSGKYFNLPGDILVRLSKTDFRLDLISAKRG